MTDQGLSQEFNFSLEQERYSSNPKGSDIFGADRAYSPMPGIQQTLNKCLLKWPEMAVRIRSREQIFIEHLLCCNPCLPEIAFNSQKSPKLLAIYMWVHWAQVKNWDTREWVTCSRLLRSGRAGVQTRGSYSRTHAHKHHTMSGNIV